MKRTIALSFALSILTATGAFASTSPTQTVAAATQVADRSSVVTPEVRVAGAGNKTFDRAEVNLDKKVVVAENRKEFGSQYQRY
ncbi:hypothetical protein [Pseudomonas syringae group sp. J309-1]|uniref:hypothetical protein n=1 Tax=Pseudomonas syringae group sp. J309-1 TaxID=3079588 RepID=UPI00210AD8ED|nr:hypothetical protein [Pseudomonas syringae group sp. J309-1]MCQ3001683.1 hypothetical protein [Pseudomonas syringae]MDU8362226.1 hypothetical protein [Pseudomonas syringae group sp. J309-1]